jgi:hypothetical protein
MDQAADATAGGKDSAKLDFLFMESVSKWSNIVIALGGGSTLQLRRKKKRNKKEFCYGEKWRKQ